MAITDKLISFWEMEEKSGTRVDSVKASGNDLSITNVPGQSPGINANAAHFTKPIPYATGSVQILSCASNPSLATGDIDFTLGFWAFHDTVTASADPDLLGQVYISRYELPAVQREYVVYLNITDHAPNNRFVFVVSNDGTAVDTLDHSTGPAASTWYFIVAWHDSVANTLNLQINNATPESKSHATGVFSGTTLLRIGDFLINGLNYWPMDGRVDQVGFWKRVLTSDERTFLYNNGNGRSYAALVGSDGSNLWVRGMI